MLRTSSRVLVVLVGAMLLAAPGWTAAVDYTGFFVTQLSVVDPNNPPEQTLGAGTVVIPDADLTGGSIQIGAGIATTAMGYSDLGTNFYRIGTMTSAAPATNPGGAIPVYIGGTAITVGNAAGTVNPSGVGALFGGQVPQIGKNSVFIKRWPGGTQFLTVVVPLGAIGGPTGGTTVFMGGLIDVTLTGNPWVTGPVTVSETRGNFTTNLMATGFDNRGTDAGMVTGTVQLVSPLAVEVGGTLGAAVVDFQVGISTVVLNFAPEPSMALMLLAGVPVALGIGLLRRRS